MGWDELWPIRNNIHSRRQIATEKSRSLIAILRDRLSNRSQCVFFLFFSLFISFSSVATQQIWLYERPSSVYCVLQASVH